MSQNDVEHHDLSEDNGNAEKTVPVSEAIRYRKRAQQAEQHLAEVQDQLSQQRQQTEQLNQQLSALHQQQALREALHEAGTTDPETTLLLAQARLAADETEDAASVVQQLRRDKPHLFAASVNTAAPDKTAGLRHRRDGNEALTSAAARAAQSGNRADLQQYLRMRRRHV